MGTEHRKNLAARQYADDNSRRVRCVIYEAYHDD
jgi:hypothetical protein